MLDQYLANSFEVSMMMIIFMFIIKIIDILQFSDEIGPLVKIIGKMGFDFLNFSAIYFILIVIFAVIGCFNFMGEN